MYKISQIKLNIGHGIDKLKAKVSKLARVKMEDINWATFKILRKSIDARDKNNILYVYNVAFDLVEKKRDDKRIIDVNDRLERYEPVVFNPIVVGSRCISIQGKRPVVVGFGPAGIFASYIFALNGLRPIVLERGKSLDDRIKDVEKFFDTMELNENSNVCFGEGGAGAFSDGKLYTNNKDHDGVYRFILETFVKFGADEKILYESMPHIGTDKLSDIIKNIRYEIVRLGGEIYFNTKFSVKDKFDAPIILAIGNSSRDTFRELADSGFDLKAKPIAVGYRIAHRQSFINDIQYGRGLYGLLAQLSSDTREVLGPATYKLTYDVGNGHSVYSFCMCPGGYIINSSNYKGYLSINGMSYNDRAGAYANSAIVESVSTDDVENLTNSFIHEGPLKMLEFQEMIEKRTYELEKGYIPYITVDGSDIYIEKVFMGQAKYSEKLKLVYSNLGLPFNINEDIVKALMYFNTKIPGFYGTSQCVIAGVETRTSSPVKLLRDENYMCNVKGFYPCGEGFGHGGGILSSAADGVRVASKATTIYCG